MIFCCGTESAFPMLWLAIFCDVHKMALQSCCRFSNRLRVEDCSCRSMGYTGAGLSFWEDWFWVFRKGDMLCFRPVLVYTFWTYIELAWLRIPWAQGFKASQDNISKSHYTCTHAHVQCVCGLVVVHVTPACTRPLIPGTVGTWKRNCYIEKKHPYLLFHSIQRPFRLQYVLIC